MENYFYIKKLVRDDGATLEFDAEEVFLAEDNANLLMRPDVETTAIDYTEADGGEMIAQKLPSFEQEINGLIFAKNTDYWTLRSRLTAFFQIKHTFFIVYTKASREAGVTGELFRSGDAWISTNLQVPPTPTEEYSNWSVGLTIGSPALQQYAENAAGQEIPANSVPIGLISGATGGSQWDAKGQVWDSVGQVWTTGEGGLKNISVDSELDVYPTWVISGTAVNPSIRNNTTRTEATYNGTVAAGQTLVVDFREGTAKLDGVVVSKNLSGELKLARGSNAVGFETEGGDATTSTLTWNNYLG